MCSQVLYEVVALDRPTSPLLRLIDLAKNACQGCPHLIGELASVSILSGDKSTGTSVVEEV